MRSIKRLARDAYCNRYAFERVSIDTAGTMLGHWEARHGRPALDPVKLGHIDDCRAVRTPTGTRFYNRDALIYTFAPGA